MFTEDEVKELRAQWEAAFSTYNEEMTRLHKEADAMLTAANTTTYTITGVADISDQDFENKFGCKKSDLLGKKFTQQR